MRTHLKLLRRLAATAALCCIAVVAHADTVTLTAIADNTLIENATGIFSNGAGDAIYAGVIPRQGNGARRALLRFDLSSIPANAQVSAATLTLTLLRTQSETSTVAVHKVTESWGEGTSLCNIPCGQGTISTTNDATWLHRFYPATNWATAGGSFVVTPSAAISVSPTVGAAFNWSSAQLTSDVQSWLATPAVNAGWVVVDGASSSSKAYASRQNPNVTQRPQLTITYAVPPPADVPLPTWALVLLGAGLFGAINRFRNRG